MSLGEAVLLHRTGKLPEAEAACRAVILAEPGHAEAWHLLGIIVHRLGRSDEALAALQRATELSPHSSKILTNLAGILGTMDRYAEAADLLSKAIKLSPEHAEAWNNLGVTHEHLGRLGDAANAYRRAISLKPAYADAHNNLGNALRKSGWARAAILSHQHAASLRPKDGAIFDSLGGAYAELGDQANAIASYRRAVALSHPPSAHSNLLYGLQYDATVTAERIFAEHLEWARRYEEPLRALCRPHQNRPDADRRLRIGYVSPDFRRHSVATFLRPLIAAHNRSDWEIYCYSDVAAPDARTGLFRSAADQWRDTRRFSHEQLARLIEADLIDVLVDPTGHMAGTRLLTFGRKPAPVQVAFPGYPGSTGLSAMDGFITDPYQDPPGLTEHLYTEKLLRVTGSPRCCDPPPFVSSPGPLPADSAGAVTFGVLQRPLKLSETMWQAWSQLLAAVPKSRLLVLLGKQARDLAALLWPVLDRHKIAPDRVEWVGRQTIEDYFRLYARVDIALDTFPYCGCTTTCDALWMGVPVVTLAGATHVSRVGASILTHAGLPEWIAQTPTQYVEIAASLASDPPRLQELRTALRDRMRGSPLLDANAVTAEFEQACRTLWRGWCGSSNNVAWQKSP